MRGAPTRKCTATIGTVSEEGSPKNDMKHRQRMQKNGETNLERRLNSLMISDDDI
jgi:hypothetical protein